MSRFTARRGSNPEATRRFGWDDYLQTVAFQFGATQYDLPVSFTSPGATETQPIGHTYGGYAHILRSNPVLWACVFLRMRVFAQAGLVWQEVADGRPGKFYTDERLDVIRWPWPGGTTGDFLAQRILDADIAGNSIIARSGQWLTRLRPDWVTLAIESPTGSPHHPDARIQGYLYQPGGIGSGETPVAYEAGAVSHWAPIPDPMVRFVGMSPISTVIQELEADRSATEHKRRFFDNAATPNLAVTPKAPLSKEQATEFLELLNKTTTGARNAGKTLFLNGADVTVVGSDLRGLNFKSTQGAGESRIAAALGVPAGLVGLSEGMAANTYSNLQQSRRVLTDGALSFSWQSHNAALEQIVKPAGRTERIWHDVRDIPFLQDDADRAAETHGKEAGAIRQLVDGGFTAESVIDAVNAGGDWGRLVHSGKLSVQLQEPGSSSNTSDEGTPPPVADEDRLNVLDLTVALQKIYLSVGKVITAEEAREILNRAGAGLNGPAPHPPPDPD